VEDLARLRAKFAADPGAHGIELAWALVNWPAGVSANRARAAAAQAEAIGALRAVAGSHLGARATARQDLVYFLSNYAHMLCSAPAATPDMLAAALDAATEAVSIQRGILKGLERSDLPVRQDEVQDAHDTLVVALIASATSATACGQISEARESLDEASGSARRGRAPLVAETLSAIRELRKRVNPLRLLPPVEASAPCPSAPHGPSKTPAMG
jgi:hypothetical protein